jgi:hypothetical protein
MKITGTAFSLQVMHRHWIPARRNMLLHTLCFNFRPNQGFPTRDLLMSSVRPKNVFFYNTVSLCRMKNSYVMSGNTTY